MRGFEFTDVQQRRITSVAGVLSFMAVAIWTLRKVEEDNSGERRCNAR
jgi:hypothetical protein